MRIFFQVNGKRFIYIGTPLNIVVFVLCFAVLSEVLIDMFWFRMINLPNKNVTESIFLNILVTLAKSSQKV